MLRKSTKFQEALAKLGFDEFINDDLIAHIESYVCAIYGYPSIHLINDVRLEMFNKAYKASNAATSNGPLSKIKGIVVGSNFPPCRSVLLQHIYRANLICRMWNLAGAAPKTDDDLPRKNPFNPVYHGWKLDDDGQYTIKWFDGEMSPKKIDDISFSSPEEESPTSSSNDDDDEEQDDLQSIDEESDDELSDSSDED